MDIGIVACKRDTTGNMGRAHAKPMLDTRLYQVEALGDRVTGLTTNVITGSMYTQCDAERDEYLLLHSLIDHRKDGRAI